MQQRPITHIIWDWNGTLLCDVQASLDSANEMLLRRGKATITLQEYQAQIAIPIRQFYAHFFDLEQEDYGALLQEYNSAYDRHLQSCGLTPGILPVLDAARKRGIVQGIVSSSEQNLLLRWLERLGAAEYFTAVRGAADFLADSKLARAQEFMMEHNASPAQTLMVGDLYSDYEVAQQIGAQCALLTSGHHSRTQLAAADATIVPDAAALLALL